VNVLTRASLTAAAATMVMLSISLYQRMRPPSERSRTLRAYRL